MPRYRALITGRDTAAPPRDVITNTFYFDDHGVGTDADGLAEDIADVIVAQTTFYKGCDEIQVRLYDMAEPVPREIQGESVKPKTMVDAGPREVALCLSFYSERNLPRNRGRAFLGPLSGHSLRPTDAHMEAALAIGRAMSGIGGVDVDWCVFSPRTLESGGTIADAFKVVDHIWVDDEWDVQRSRGLKSTKRFDEATSG